MIVFDTLEVCQLHFYISNILVARGGCEGRFGGRIFQFEAGDEQIILSLYSSDLPV